METKTSIIFYLCSRSNLKLIWTLELYIYICYNKIMVRQSEAQNVPKIERSKNLINFVLRYIIFA